MKGTDEFKNTIERYIVGFADNDPQFAERASRPGKSIDGCVGYILDEVRKSGVCGFTDDEIYSMAVHYYIEDCTGTDKIPDCTVIVNHRVELSAEEIEEQRRKAKEKVFADEMTRLRTEGRQARPKPASETSGQLFAFD